MTTKSLLPCPRCGSAAPTSLGDREGLYVLCTRCGLRTSAHDTIAGAVSQWNFRPGHEAAGTDGGSVRPARPRGVDGEAKKE